MILAVEAIGLCILFTLMVFIIAREPIKTLYNYPPKIQERVKSLDAYKNQIPTEENKVVAKIGASILFVIILSLLMRYVNGYTTFGQALCYGFLLWTVVNLFDLVVLDILWFCHDPHFVFRGTEDMVKDYHDYGFHFKGFLIGEALALIICASAGVVVQFVL